MAAVESCVAWDSERNETSVLITIRMLAVDKGCISLHGFAGTQRSQIESVPSLEYSNS